MIGLHSAVAAPSADAPGPGTSTPSAPGPRTIAILAPPLQQVGSGPCWQADRPGIVDAAAMAPVIDDVLRAVRGAAARAGGLDSVDITIVGERDECPARPDLRQRLGAEPASYFADWLAVGARTRILRKYLVERLAARIGAEPGAYAWKPSGDAIHAVLEAIVRTEWRDGDIPLLGTPKQGGGKRRFAILVTAPREAPRESIEAPAADRPASAPDRSASAPDRVAAPREQIVARPAPPQPGRHGAMALAVRGLMMSALGTSHHGGQVEWARSWSLGPIKVRGGARLGIVASDDAWANGGRLSRSSLGLAGVPILASGELGGFDLRVGVVASALIGLAAARGELEVGVYRRMTTNLALGVASAPALTVARADSNYWGWTHSISLERKMP